MSRTIVGLIEAEFRKQKAVGEGAFRQMDEEQLGTKLEGGNSVATLVWHVSGNLASRFTDFLTSDGEKPWRDRPSEFLDRSASAAELEEKWAHGWSVLFDALGSLDDDDLARTVAIRGAEASVGEALLRALTHITYHVGQIVFVAKSLVGSSWRYLSVPPSSDRRP
jgi:uncharacterized damage-inducible protein DinB